MILMLTLMLAHARTLALKADLSRGVLWKKGSAVENRS